jgi:NDP-sugar pyrophosphorylase family protein
MKVVLFCGGLGLRIRDAEDIPKPMVQIGDTASDLFPRTEGTIR